MVVVGKKTHNRQGKIKKKQKHAKGVKRGGALMRTGIFSTRKMRGAEMGYDLWRTAKDTTSNGGK